MSSMTFEEIMNNLPANEATDDMVERIAKAWHNTPCPPGDRCNPECHDWDNTAEEEDKQWARDIVRFVLTEAGLG